MAWNFSWLHVGTNENPPGLKIPEIKFLLVSSAARVGRAPVRKKVGRSFPTALSSAESKVNALSFSAKRISRYNRRPGTSPSRPLRALQQKLPLVSLQLLLESLCMR